MTTKDVIKLLPIDEKLKVQTLNLFDYMTPEQRLRVERIAWNTYYLLFKKKVDENQETQLSNIIDDKEEFDDDFIERARAKADEQIANELEESGSIVDLAAARKAMEQIVQEISDAKK